jgi:hypothetical protein
VFHLTLFAFFSLSCPFVFFLKEKDHSNLRGIIHLIHLSICSKDDPPFYDVCRWSSGDGTPMVASLSSVTDL